MSKGSYRSIAISLAIYLISSNPALASTVTVTGAERDQLRLEHAQEAVTKHNYRTAFVRFNKLAKRGQPAAQHVVGLMYERGIGVSKNMRKAVAWYQKSAKQDFADAQSKLGHMYLAGNEVVVQDFDQAHNWLAKAAEKGVPEAQFSLGAMHANGQGVKQDLSKAAFFFKQAASQDLTEAKEALAKLPPLPSYDEDGAGQSSRHSGQSLWSRFARH